MIYKFSKSRKMVIALMLLTLTLTFFSGCGKEKNQDTTTSPTPTVTDSANDSTPDATDSASTPTPDGTETPEPTPTEEPIPVPTIANAKTFPDGTKIAGIDISGKTFEDANKALKQKINDYSVKATLDNTTFVIKASDALYSLNKDFSIAKYYDYVTDEGEKKPNPIYDEKLYVFGDEKTIKANILKAYYKAKYGNADYKNTDTIDVTKPNLVFDKSSNKFKFEDGKDYVVYDYTEALGTIYKACVNFEKTASAQSKSTTTPKESASEVKDAQTIIDKANSYIDLAVKIDFTMSDGKTTYETIPAATLAGFVNYDKKTTAITINKTKVTEYVTSVSKNHSKAGTEAAKFMTHDGSYITLDAKVGSETVNATDLTTKVYNTVGNKKSDTLKAVYNKDTNEAGILDFGGTYCEVDLEHQKVYAYKNGKLIVDAPCVTGCVSNGNYTPNGLYQIWLRNSKCYLDGPGYHTYVNYFVAFNRGIGFHDALWRSSFGGTTYLYSGSHGCINMPLNPAAVIYENFKVGDYVVCYGGISKLSQKTPEWTGKTTYQMKASDKPVLIERKANNARLTYTTSNSKVCTVSDAGYIQPVGVGTATITINSSATGVYKASTSKVTVTITKGTGSVVANPNKLTIETGKSAKLNITAKTALTYKSSNPSVATVDSKGNVKAIATGTATITVSSADTASFSAASTAVTITVVKPAPTPTATPKPTQAPTATPEPTVEPTTSPEPTVEPTPSPEPTAEPTPAPEEPESSEE